MARTILFLFLLFLCVSDITVHNSYERTFSEEISMDLPLYDIAIVDNSEMCKPTGVETVIYTEGRTEPAPEKKRTVTKVSKKKTSKKNQPKKA